MSDQPQFDHLRRDCSARLEEFIIEVRETERRTRNIKSPATVQEVEWFTTQRGTELDACHEYILASRQLVEFLDKHVRSIQ